MKIVGIKKELTVSHDEIAFELDGEPTDKFMDFFRRSNDSWEYGAIGPVLICKKLQGVDEAFSERHFVQIQQRLLDANIAVTEQNKTKQQALDAIVQSRQKMLESISKMTGLPLN